jgi:hypothetical protein
MRPSRGADVKELVQSPQQIANVRRDVSVPKDISEIAKKNVFRGKTVRSETDSMNLLI